MAVGAARHRMARVGERERRELAVAEAVLAAVGGEERILEHGRVLPQRSALRAPTGDGAGQRIARLVEVARRNQPGLRSACRRRGAARHQQLQLGGGRQVVDRTAQIADPAGAEHRLLDLQDATRVAAIGVEVDRRQDTAVGAADREGDVDGAEQVVPVANPRRIARLREAHERQLRKDDVVRQRLAQELVDATLIGGKDRPRRERPIGRQRWRPARPAREPERDQRDQESHRHHDPRKAVHHERSTPMRGHSRRNARGSCAC